MTEKTSGQHDDEELQRRWELLAEDRGESVEAMQLRASSRLASLKRRRFGGTAGYNEAGEKTAGLVSKFLQSGKRIQHLRGSSERLMKTAFWAGFEKQARELTTKTRNRLPDSAFVFPETRKFPIHDIAHAKNALARAHFASDPAKVRAAVYAKYPELKERHK